MEKDSLLNSDRFVHVLMLITVILAASSFPVGALITNKLPPENLMFLRFLLASVLFAPIVFFRHGIKLPPWRMLFNYILLSIPLAVFFWCMFESLRYTSILNTGALYTTVPAITAVYAYIINREITGRIRSIGLVVGTIGALWIVFRGNLDDFLGLKLNYGDFIFLVGSLFLGLYNPLVKRLHRGEPMEVMTFWVLLSGSGLLLAASIKNISHVEWQDIDRNVYLWVLYLSLFTTLATFLVINYSTVRIGATKVSAYGLLTPVFVIAISVLAGMEPFELITIPGLLLIIGAMFLIQIDDIERVVKIIS